jgi:ribosome-binding protein aMBF1 (putative translation factor)
MESQVAAAREFHRKSLEHSRRAYQYRRQRDDAIRRAYAETRMSYGSLAKQIGCSPELVAKAVQGRG